MLPAASSLYTGNIRINGYYLKYKCIHHYEVAGTSGHYKEMKDLMASEIFVLIVKDWKLQSIDHAANGVDDTAGQEPSKGLARKRCDNLSKGQHADPAHGNVNQGRKPFGAGDPQRVYENACSGNAPYQRQKEPAGAVAQNQHTDRSVGPGNQNENHHVVHLAQHAVYLR